MTYQRTHFQQFVLCVIFIKFGQFRQQWQRHSFISRAYNRQKQTLFFAEFIALFIKLSVKVLCITVVKTFRQAYMFRKFQSLFHDLFKQKWKIFKIAITRFQYLCRKCITVNACIIEFVLNKHLQIACIWILIKKDVRKFIFAYGTQFFTDIFIRSARDKKRYIRIYPWSILTEYLHKRFKAVHAVKFVKSVYDNQIFFGFIFQRFNKQKFKQTVFRQFVYIAEISEFQTFIITVIVFGKHKGKVFQSIFCRACCGAVIYAYMNRTHKFTVCWKVLYKCGFARTCLTVYHKKPARFIWIARPFLTLFSKPFTPDIIIILRKFYEFIILPCPLHSQMCFKLCPRS